MEANLDIGFTGTRRGMSDAQNTAWGVLQAANTYEHHFAASRGASKYSRNMSRMVYGQVAEMDSTALKVLASVK